MAQQLVNIGTVANDGTGDTLRDAFDKTNDNFTELYSKFSETVITASGSVDALRVTNTGTGNSLLIEDSSNPDSTPFVVDSSGNVGIGTSAPATALDVFGVANFGSTINTGNNVSTGQAAIELGGLRTGDGNSFIDFHSTSSTDFEARLIRSPATNGAFTISNTGTGAFTIRQSGAGVLAFDTSNTERMRIDSSGNVGIGTASPAGFGKFAVVGVSGTPIINYSDGTITGTSGYTSGGVAYSGARSNHPIGFLTNDTPRMIVDTSGNVGIANTPSGTYKLEVTGNIYASTTVSDSKGNVRSIPQNNPSSNGASYTLVAADTGKHVYITGTALGVTIPANVFSVGDNIMIVNNLTTPGNISIVTSAVTCFLAGTSTSSSPRTLAQRGVATILCVASNTFFISGAGLT